MATSRMPFGNRVPGILFTETSILPVVGGQRDTITCIIGTAKSGPVDPTIVTSIEDLEVIFGSNLVDNYGIRAAQYVLPNTVMYVRVVSKGARVCFKDNAIDVFIAKEGGVLLQGAEVSVTVENDIIDVALVKDDEILETVRCSSNPLDGEFIHKVFDNYSSYLRLGVSEDYEFTSKVFNGVGGSEGAKCAEGIADNMKVSSKYPDARLNGVKVNLGINVKGKPYITLTQGKQVIEEIPYSSEIESMNEFKERVNSSSVYINLDELTSIVATTVTLEGGNAGISNLENQDYIDAINRIADPAVFRIDQLLIPGVTESQVQTHAMRVCENRGDTLFLADTPLGLKAGAARDFINAKGRFSSRNALNSSFVATYSPWVKINDGNIVYYPPSIIIAKQMADNDKTFHVWDACAGIKRATLGGIAGLEYNPSKNDMDILYNDGLINPIVNITGKGFVVWGNKTTKIPVYKVAPEPICSANVRRLLNYLRKAIYDVTLPLVFEANDAVTWASMNNAVKPILDAVQDSRGIDAYQFICDETTNTAANIDQLLLTAILKIRPTRAAEYIDVHFKVYPYTVEFDGGEN
jgi:phage tail sheath protein FI